MKAKNKKSESANAAETNSYAITKMSKDEPVDMRVIINLCKVFHSKIEDIVK